MGKENVKFDTIEEYDYPESCQECSESDHDDDDTDGEEEPEQKKPKIA
jgi:hypothetical protein